MAETKQKPLLQLKKDKEAQLKEQMDKSEKDFLTIVKQLEVKYESKKYYEYQSLYFHGAASIIGTMPAR